MDYKPKKNIKEYLKSNNHFLIPAFQRGYKWGVCGSDGSSAAKNLILDIKRAFEDENRDEYFIQGVTGYEKDDIFYLIDGQQRTTTLFLIIALLADEKLRSELLFDKAGKELRLIYWGKRHATALYLTDLCRDGFVYAPTDKQDTQDIHFLCKAANDIEALLPKDPASKSKLLDYILSKVFLFQIEVEIQEAPNVFSMMNGNKADMKIEELIKAQYLSGLTKLETVKTIQTTENVENTLRILESQIADATAREWKINASRSRLAREWDKWVYWWTRPEVRSFYHITDNDLTGWLFPVFCMNEGVKYDSNPKVEVRNQSFNAFSVKFLQNNELKNSFESIRKLQKRMEDLYEDTTTFNLLGFLLDILEAKERADVIIFFTENKDKVRLFNYTIFRMANLTHKQAVERINGEKEKESDEKVKYFINFFEKENIYGEGLSKEDVELSNRYLFFCNVMAAEERNSKFEFWYTENNNLVHYWTKRSIEHIWPKSKVSDKGGEGNVSRSLLDKCGISEHMLGNLVFLHTLDNTRFRDDVPKVKRQRYFDLRIDKDKKFYSRGMLHTMAAYGGEKWELDPDNIPQIIQERHKNEIKILKDRYGIKD